MSETRTELPERPAIGWGDLRTKLNEEMAYRSVIKRELLGSSKPRRIKLTDGAFHDGYYAALLNLHQWLDDHSEGT